MKIKVRVKPNSGKSGVVRGGEKYLVFLKSSPEENKANIELVKLLSKYLKKKVEIKSGLKSKIKILEIEDR